jgi:hypothetical protein
VGKLDGNHINFDLGPCGPSVELGAKKLRTRVRSVLVS